MKISLTLLAVGLAALVAAAGPAFSADWNNGAGAPKGYGSTAVPVPAPITVPNGPTSWYLRADIGAGFGKNGTIGSDGLDLGLLGSFSDQNPNGMVKLGFGRYVTPSLRVDLTLDIRNQQKAAKDKRSSYRQSQTETDVLTPGDTVTSTYRFDRDQQLTTANQTIMTNAYYDIGGYSGFKPYISGGIGLAVRTTKYQHNEKSACVGSVITDATGVTTDVPGGCLASFPPPPPNSSKGVNNGYGLALAVGTGFGYALAPNITLDVGYRYLWQQQQMTLATPAGFNGGRIKFEGLGEHELTTGLRFDID